MRNQRRRLLNVLDRQSEPTTALACTTAAARDEVVEAKGLDLRKGITRRAFTDQEILERCFYPMVNEGAKILEEGMAQRSLDIDVIWVNGYGWPVYRGGPMWWADNVVGLKTIHDALLKYRDASGDPFWEPAPLLKKLVQEGKKFSTV